MRLFLGIPITPALRDQVVELQKHFQTSGADITWTAPQNLHITVKFLGELTKEQAGLVKQAMTSRLSTIEPFQMALRGVGGFPTREQARVIWAGISHGKDPLEKLADAVEKAYGPLGFPTEQKPFRAHLTIGRTRSMAGHKRLVKLLEEVSFRGNSSWPVESVTLFHSELTRQGPVYRPLAVFPFKPAEDPLH
jgi:2'-5' RNA ligase